MNARRVRPRRLHIGIAAGRVLLRQLGGDFDQLSDVAGSAGSPPLRRTRRTPGLLLAQENPPTTTTTTGRKPKTKESSNARSNPRTRMNEMPTFAEKRLALEERAPRQDAKHGVARGVDRARRARASARTRSGSRCSTRGARPRSTKSTRAGLELCDAVRLVADGHVPDKVWEEAEATSKPDELAQVVFRDRGDQRLEPARDHRPNQARGQYQPPLANAV